MKHHFKGGDMKYLIAVKLDNTRNVEIFEFDKKKNRTDFYNDIRNHDNVKDVAFSQMEEK